jgi:hypothetical protein
MPVEVCLLLVAGSIGGVGIDIRVGNCLDSVISALDNQLDVSCSETIDTLEYVSKCV